MTPCLKSLQLQVKGAVKSPENGVTFRIPTDRRTASRLALNRGGGGQDAAHELVASPRDELRRLVQDATKAVSS